MIPAWKRPLCKSCRKRTRSPGSSRCLACAKREPMCFVCHCRNGLNFENCRACSLAVRIAIMRVRLRVQWLQLKSALKEMIDG